MSKDKRETLIAKLCCEARESDVAPCELFALNEGRWPETKTWRIYGIEVPASLIPEIRKFYCVWGRFSHIKGEIGSNVFVVSTTPLTDIIFDFHFPWRTNTTADPVERIKELLAKEQARREKEERRRAEKERREAEKREWIEKNGSELLKLNTELGCDCTRQYLFEKARLEVSPVARVYSRDQVKLNDRVCASLKGAQEVKRLREMGYPAQIAWTVCIPGKHDVLFEEEAVIIPAPWGYENFVIVILTEEIGR